MRQRADRARHFIAMSAILAIASGMTTAAFAAATRTDIGGGADAGATAAAAGDVDVIIVNGQAVEFDRLGQANDAGSRLGLSSFETPASVELITRHDIAMKGDYNVLSAVTRATGFSGRPSPGNGGTSVSVRGFSGPNSIVTTYDGTRLYVAAGTVTFPVDTWTVQRVEVLRGAGSVINGIGAIGATVNYIPKTPHPGETDFDMLLSAGSFGKRRVALGGGTDLSDTLAVRLDGAWQRSDGYVDRNSRRRGVFAGSLLFHPTDRLKMRLSVDYADVHQDSPYFGTPLIDGEASEAHREQNYNFADGLTDYRDIWTRLKTEWQLSSNITFHNETYVLDVNREWQNLEQYAYNETTGLIDRDGSSYFGIIHKERQVGTRTDVLINTDWGKRSNRLTVGADVNSIDFDYYDNWSQGIVYAGNSVPPSGFVPDVRANANVPTVLDYTTDTQQFGLFFDDVLELTQRLSLVAGARLDEIHYSLYDYPLGGNPATSFDADYSELSWRAGLVYRPNDDLSFYAQYSEASDPISSPITMGSGSSELEPTRGRQAEVGVKQRLMDGRAEYTLSYYNIVKTDIVTRIPGTHIDEQIGQQSSNGVELTFRVRPAESLAVTMNAAWVNAEYDEYYSGGISLAGNTPRNIPETTANAWLRWMPLDALSFGAGLRYVDTRFVDRANTHELPAYTLAEASASWAFSEQLQLTLRVRNLTNEKNYVLSSYGSASQWIFGAPRNYEISVRYSM